MRPKAFTILALATALALVVAITNYAAQTRLSAERVSGEPLLPGLAMQAAKIAKIELRQGEKTITLARDKDTWSLADRGGYPAKPDAVRALLIKLAQAELVEAKTRNKDRYSLLELEDPDGKDAKSRLVRLTDDKGTLIAAAVVGKKRSDAFGANKSGTYVRRPADMQTWLANAEIDVPMVVRDFDVLEEQTRALSRERCVASAVRDGCSALHEGSWEARLLQSMPASLLPMRIEGAGSPR